MFVRRVSPEDGEVLEPTWPQIESAIRELNGETRTLVMLDMGGEVPHMGIGGGNAKQYLVYVTYDNLNFFTLVDNNRHATERVYLVCGGQEADYPANTCIDLQTVLQAAKTFAETGLVDVSLTWKTD